MTLMACFLGVRCGWGAEATTVPEMATPEAAAQWFAQLARDATRLNRSAAVEALRLTVVEAVDTNSVNTALAGLSQAVADADKQVAETARFSLDRLTSATGLPGWARDSVASTFARALTNGPPSVQVGLARRLIGSGTNRAQGAAVLLRLLDQEDLEVWRDAITILPSALQDDPAALAQLKERLLREPLSSDPLWQLAAVSGLNALVSRTHDAATRAAAETVWLRVMKDPDAAIRSNALERVNGFLYGDRAQTPASEAITNALLAALADPDPHVRLQTANRVGEAGRYATNRALLDQALDVYADLLSSADRRQRETAFEAFLRAHWCWQWVQDDPETRVVGGSTQTWRGNRSVLEPRLLPAWTNALTDPDLALRLKALQAAQSSGNPSRDLRPHAATALRSVVEGLNSSKTNLEQMAWRIVFGSNGPLLLKSNGLEGIAGLYRTRLSKPGQASDVRPLMDVPTVAASILLGGPDEAGLALVAGLLDHPEAQVRLAAARRLTGFIRPSPDYNSMDWVSLAPMNAGATVSASNWASIPARLERLASDPFPQVSLTALDGLVATASNPDLASASVDARTRLQDLVQRGPLLVRARIPLLFDRQATLRGLQEYVLSQPGLMRGAIDDSLALSLLQPALQDADAIVRRNAALALSSTGRKVPAEILAQMDSDLREKANASRAQAIKQAPYLDASSPRYDELKKALTDKEPETRHEAALMLATKGAMVLQNDDATADRVVEVLLENYRVGEAVDFEELNRALLGVLVYGRGAAGRQQRVAEFVKTGIQSDLPERRQYLWKLASALIYQARVDPDVARPTTTVLAPLAPVALEQCASTNLELRAAALNCLGPMISVLGRSQSGEAQRLAPKAARVLIEAAKDGQPETVRSTALRLIQPMIAMLITLHPQEAQPLTREAARVMIEAAQDGQPEAVRSTALSQVQSMITTLAATQPQEAERLGPEVARLLIDAVKSGSLAITATATEAITGAMGGFKAEGASVLPSEALRQEAMTALAGRLRETDPQIRVNAGCALAVLVAQAADTNRLSQTLDVILAPADPGSARPPANPSGEIAPSEILRTVAGIAFRASAPEVRSLAMERLLRLLDQTQPRKDDLWRTWDLSPIQWAVNDGLPHPSEAKPIVQRLLSTATGTTDAATFSATQLLGVIFRAAGRSSSELWAEVAPDLQRLAASTKSDQRLLVLQLLARLASELGDAGAQSSWDLAVPLASDAEATVRAAALDTLGRVGQHLPKGLTPAQTGVLTSAMNDADPRVQDAAAKAVARAALRSWPNPVVAKVGPELLRRIPSADSELRGLLSYQVERLVPEVTDAALRREVVEGVAKSAAAAKTASEKADWLQVLGELRMALGQPADAAKAYQEALQADPGRTGQINDRLAKALWAAGRREEADKIEARQVNTLDIAERLRNLAMEGNAPGVIETAQRAIDRLASQPGRQSYSIDQIIRQATESLMRMNRLTELETFLRQQLAARPNSYAVLGLGQLLVARNETDQALDLCEKAFVADPDSQARYEVSRFLAETCRRLQRLDRLESIYLKAFETRPGSSFACGQLVDCYVQNGRTNQARLAIARHRDVSKNPAPRDGELSNLASMLARVGDFDEAIALQRRTMESSEGSKDEYQQRQLADFYRQAGRTNELAQLLAASPRLDFISLLNQLQQQSNDGDVNAALATEKTLLAMPLEPEQKQNVRETFFSGTIFGPGKDAFLQIAQERMKEQPADFFYPRLIGEYYICQNNWEKALSFYEQAYRLDPSQTQVTERLAWLCLENGLPGRALEILEKPTAAKVEPFNRRNVLLAQARLAVGDSKAVEDQIAVLERQLAELPTSGAQSGGRQHQRTSLRRDLATIQGLLGRDEQAVELMRLVIADSSQWNSGDRDFLVDRYEKLGRVDDAVAVYRAGLADVQHGSSAWYQGKLARLYARHGKLAEAEPLFEASQAAWLQQIKAGQADAGLYNNIAWLYAEHGVKTNDALSFARQAVALAPQDFLLRDTLAWALWRARDHAGAFAAFASVLTNSGGANEAASASCWRGLNEMAASPDTPAPVFLASAESLRAALGTNLVGRARLELALAQFHQTRGETSPASAARLASGFPSEQRWLVIGPFPNVEGQGLSRAFVPEDRLEPDRTATSPGRAATVRWESRFDGSESGVVNLGGIFPGTEWATTYAWTSLSSERKQVAELRVGAGEQVKVWLNGRLILERSQVGSIRMDEHILPVTLAKGANRILVKTCVRRGAWGFALRLTAPSGQPLRRGVGL